MTEEKTKNKSKEYTAFGVTGSIGTIIGIAIIMLISRPQFWQALHKFIEPMKNYFGD